jgi:hypothetical protein
MPQFRRPPNLIKNLTSLSVTSLELSSAISHDELAALARVRSIKSLSLTMFREDNHVDQEEDENEEDEDDQDDQDEDKKYDEEDDEEDEDIDVDHSAGDFQKICSGAFTHLRSLSLESVIADFRCLSALPCLTGLSLILRGSGELRLEPLAALTGLKELSINLLERNVGNHASCSFLGALTGLTGLILANPAGWRGDNKSQLFTLTALACLKKLHLGFIPSPPSYADESHLPRELAFLKTSTTLQDFKCDIAVKYFQELSIPASEALQHALAKLTCLTCLQLLGFDVDTNTPYSYLPLELCLCAASLRSLVFEEGWSSRAAESPRQGMLSSLQHLQCLDLKTFQDSVHIVSLLDGIHPPQLSKLALAHTSLTFDVMESILRFTKLRDLQLWSGSASLPSFLQLFSLDSLTRLAVHAPRSDDGDYVSHDAWISEVEDTLAAVQENFKRLRHECGWPPLKV